MSVLMPPSYNFKGDRAKSISLKSQAAQAYQFYAKQAELGGINQLNRTVVLNDGSLIKINTYKDDIYNIRKGFVTIISSAPFSSAVKEYQESYITVALDYIPALAIVKSSIFLNKGELKTKFAPKTPSFITTIADTNTPPVSSDLYTSSPLTPTEGGPEVLCISYNYSDTNDLISFTGPQTVYSNFWNLPYPQSGACVHYMGRRFLGVGDFCFDARVKGKMLYMLTGYGGINPSIYLYIIPIASCPLNGSVDLSLTSPIYQQSWSLGFRQGFLCGKISPEGDQFSVLLGKGVYVSSSRGYSSHSNELIEYSISNTNDVYQITSISTTLPSSNLDLKVTTTITTTDPGQYVYSYYESSFYNTIYGWDNNVGLSSDRTSNGGLGEIFHITDSFSPTTIYFYDAGVTGIWEDGYTQTWEYPAGTTYVYTRHTTITSFSIESGGTGDTQNPIVKKRGIGIYSVATKNGAVITSYDQVSFPPEMDNSFFILLDNSRDIRVYNYVISEKLVTTDEDFKKELVGSGFPIGFIYDSDINSITYNQKKWLYYKGGASPGTTHTLLKYYRDVISHGAKVLSTGSVVITPPPNTAHPAYSEIQALIDAHIPIWKTEETIYSVGNFNLGLYLENTLISKATYKVDDTCWTGATFKCESVHQRTDGLNVRLVSQEYHRNNTSNLNSFSPNYPLYEYGQEGSVYPEHGFAVYKIDVDDVDCAVVDQPLTGYLTTNKLLRTSISNILKVTTNRDGVESTVSYQGSASVNTYTEFPSIGYGINVPTPGTTSSLLGLVPWWDATWDTGFRYEIAKGIYIVSVGIQGTYTNYSGFKRNQIWLEDANGVKISDINSIKTSTGLVDINAFNNYNYLVQLGTANIAYKKG